MNITPETPNVNPTFWITKKKDRLKTYQSKDLNTLKKNVVYLNDGDNFELELYNPTKNKVKCTIEINGNIISTSGLVLYPGQRYYLDRFIDTDNKFVYKTYSVSNDEETNKAIVNNGLISVSFYSEYIPNLYYYNSGISFGSSTAYLRTTTGGNIFSTLNMSNPTSIDSLTINSSNLNLETGIVDKGEKSEQQFSSDFGSYNSYPTTTVDFKILPISQKLIETKEIRNFCSSCGQRVRHDNWKFCPNCGQEF